MIITTTNSVEGRPTDIDYEVLGKAGSMLMVTSASTAVELSPEGA